MSRHRKIPAYRSRAVALIATGAFTVATAAAAAATWPSGTTAGHPRGAAGSLLTVTGQPLQMRAFEQRIANQSLQSDQIRDPASGLAAYGQAARAPAAREPAARAITAASQPASQPAAQSTAQSISGAQPTQAATAATGSPQHIAEAMLASFGWSSSQFSCLNPLWAHESGWSVTAYNAGSGAYGIPQALPGSRMASAGPNWQTNATTQIRWGLEYIQGTYGSPCAALDHEQATGWY